MKIHLIAPFHTFPSKSHSHCAFTGKALRFPKMVQKKGFEVIEYANEGSESEAKEKVVILNKDEYNKFFPEPNSKQPGKEGNLGNPGWGLFHSKLSSELKNRVNPGDVIAHTFGVAHKDLTNTFKFQDKILHLETGVGYPDKPFGAFRVFESETWRAWHWGHAEARKAKFNDVAELGLSTHYSWVIPNYYDIDEWPQGRGRGNYFLYMGRLIPSKGIATLADLIKRFYKQNPNSDKYFVFAGAGDLTDWFEIANFNQFELSKIKVIGPVIGDDRAQVMGDAIAILMPTEFQEPFGGAGVEAMLCGTPLISSNFGAFVETNKDGYSGFRCNILAQWVMALNQARNLSRWHVRQYARNNYSLETCGEMYEDVFYQLNTLWNKGWET